MIIKAQVVVARNKQTIRQADKQTNRETDKQQVVCNGSEMGDALNLCSILLLFCKIVFLFVLVFLISTQIFQSEI